MKQSLVTATCHLLLCCLLLCTTAPFLSAAEKNDKKNKPAAGKAEQQFVQINFPDIDLNLLINLISQMTGKNFIIDPAVKGKVTIICPDKISVEDAYRVFESVLEVHGFATVPSGSVIKIVPAVQARSKSIPTIFKGETSRTDDKVVTRIIPIVHSTPEEMRKLIAPLISKTTVVMPHEQSGLLIITDALSSINRLLEIIKAADVPAAEDEMEIIPLKYASAESIGKSIGQLFVQAAAARRQGAGGMPPQSVKIIPYERTNSLIVFAPKEQLEKLKRLLEQLDKEVTTEDGNIHVYYLQHANAEEMVKVLTSLPTSKQGKETENNKIVQPKAEEQTQPKTEQQPKTAAQTAASAQLSADIKITADPETNALIVTAEQEEYMALEEVIKQLDIPRRMVYLEALIMEVSIDKQFEIGAEWGGLGSFHDETGTLGSGFSKGSFNMITGIAKGTAGMSSGATFGILKKGVEIGGTYFPNIGAVVNAFQKDSDINIIATPQILTTDNKEATITVGENVPYITSKNSSSTGSTQDYTNYEYKDVGTTLKITPQINQANLLRLDIGVEVTRLKSEAGVATPTTYKRSAATTVVIHNQEIVVIGGMIGQDATSGDYKVPGLGDVPVLGWLFKTHEKSQRKTNMFIFIAPKIVESAPELADLYYKKRDKMEEEKPGSGEVPEKLLKSGQKIEHAYALMDRGFAKLQNKEYGEAKKYFEQSLKNAPENPYALINLGTVYQQEGKKDKAAETYQQVLDLVKKEGDQDAALLTAVRAHLRQLKQENKQAEKMEPTAPKQEKKPEPLKEVPQEKAKQEKQ
ncbi:MAG: type II secretion system protein D (GspD) [Candidatus Electronema aureum]|uniref:Type II secretion system protein D (GspD) n=1 Tax=Candidatus Electronema aureum TaxID=2005002 RepID=A0A521G0T6_9BACT|nr:MAG: type II secretion system protein D (GspD) [Candidatus Electronema aureum]